MEMKNANRTLVGKPLRKFLVETPTKIWEDNVKTDFSEKGCEDLQWRTSVLATLNLRVLLSQRSSPLLTSNSSILREN